VLAKGVHSERPWCADQPSLLIVGMTANRLFGDLSMLEVLSDALLTFDVWLTSSLLHIPLHFEQVCNST